MSTDVRRIARRGGRVEAVAQDDDSWTWTVIFTVSFYFAWPYLLGRFFLKASGRDPGRGQQPEQDRKA